MSGRRGTRSGPPEADRNDIWHIVILVVIVLCLVFVLVGWGFWWRWTGKQDDSCNDFNSCTTDLCLPDGTCVFREKKNGSRCERDVCYHPETPLKECVCGRCTAPREYCMGHCFNNNDCPDLDVDPRLDGSPYKFCMAQSCIYVIIGGFTADCDSWLISDQNTPVNSSNPAGKQGCFFTRQEDVGGLFLPGKCFYRYHCAPFDFQQIVSMDESEITMHITDFDTPVTVEEAKYVSWIYSKAGAQAQTAYDAGISQQDITSSSFSNDGGRTLPKLPALDSIDSASRDSINNIQIKTASHTDRKLDDIMQEKKNKWKINRRS